MNTEFADKIYSRKQEIRIFTDAYRDFVDHLTALCEFLKMPTKCQECERVNKANFTTLEYFESRK